MIAFVVAVSILLFFLAYRFYGRFLSRRLGLDDARPTPAHEINDGLDHVPARAGLLLGQHFSAISAAGPIVGPILAGMWFGWAPALLWIVIGAIFVGGVHDFSSLVASVRHRAASVGELVKRYMSPTSHVLFLTFVWLALIYVIIAFTDITAHTFKAVAGDTAFGPGVAATSALYLMLSVLMGVSLYKLKHNLVATTAVFLPLVLLSIYLGTKLPAPLSSFLSGISVKEWDALLLAYCYAASLIPVWMLLQPRGYLGGWLLYLTIGISLIGALFGGYAAEYPAFNIEGMRSLSNGKFVFPLLFITIACGACSGFHGIVSSGTTSKQLNRESDARRVGYGAMLLEGLVAVLALATLMMLPKGDAALKADPNLIYANGIAGYMGLIGIDFKFALAFALLAFSTFVYDTLDVCSRLARYILQELLGGKVKANAYLAAFITLSVPFAVLMLTKQKAYLVAWPIFGTSNQLLASLILLSVSMWLISAGRSALFAVLPMVFMLAMTLWSLVLQFLPFLKSLPGVFDGEAMKPDTAIAGIFGLVLFGLSIRLLIEAGNLLLFSPKKAAETAETK